MDDMRINKLFSIWESC